VREQWFHLGIVRILLGLGVVGWLVVGLGVVGWMIVGLGVVGWMVIDLGIVGLWVMALEDVVLGLGDIITVDLKYSNTMQPQQRVPIFNCFQNGQVHSNWAYNELRFLVSTKSEGSSKMPNVYE
jgi:hypothetical protein